MDTIVSRCQVIPFAALPLALAATVINRHRPELDTESCRTLAALADGCPGQALALENEGTLDLYGKIIEGWLAPPRTEGERVEQALMLAVEVAEAREGMEPLLRLLRIFLKNAMAARTDATAFPFPGEVMQARERWNLARLSAKMAAIDLAEQALARNCNRGLTSEA